MSSIVSEGWHWRNTMRPIRFFSLDGRSSFFIVLFILHARKSTLLLLILIYAFFMLLERKGLSFDAAWRAMRVWLIGPRRPAWVSSRRRRLLDTGGY